MPSIQKKERKNGTTYTAVVRVRGYPTRSKTFRRLTDARRWGERMEMAIRDGEFHNVVSQARKKTVSDVIDLYRKEVLPSKAVNTQRVEETYLKFWEDHLGDYALSLLKADVIATLLHDLAEAGDTRSKQHTERKRKPKSRKTIKHYRDTLELLFKYAIQWGWTASNPVQGVNRITKIRNERDRFLSDEERSRLVKVCKQSPNHSLYPVVVFALATGARKSEILNLTMSDLDLQAGKATFRNTKNGDTRRVSLAKHLRAVLSDHIERTTELYEKLPSPPPKLWVFPRADGLKPIDIRSAWEHARDAAQLIDFRFHDLRHSTASYLAMNGANQVEIAEVLGHRTLQMVRRYAHLSDDHLKDLMEDLNEKMF